MNVGRAIFLDRDGTIIEDVGYLADPARVKLLPDCAASLASLSAAGFKLVIVSNQSGIGRGLISPEQARRVDDEIDSGGCSTMGSASTRRSIARTLPAKAASAASHGRA